MKEEPFLWRNQSAQTDGWSYGSVEAHLTADPRVVLTVNVGRKGDLCVLV